VVHLISGEQQQLPPSLLQLSRAAICCFGHENWLKATRYLNMGHLKEQKKAAGRILKGAKPAELLVRAADEIRAPYQSEDCGGPSDSQCGSSCWHRPMRSSN